MKCYYHPNQEAIAICKNCYRSLCMECVVDVDNGMACRNSCEGEVIALNELLNKNKTAYKKTKKIYSRQGIFMVLTGIFFLAFGFLAFKSTEGISVWFILLGLFFIVGGSIYYFSGRSFDQVKKIKSS